MKKTNRLLCCCSFCVFCLMTLSACQTNLQVATALKEAARRNPNDDAVFKNLGKAYRKLGMYHEAVEAYKSALRLNPRSEASLELLTLYDDLDENQKVVVLSRGMMTQNIEPVWAKLYLGYALNELGKQPEAIRTLTETLPLLPQTIDPPGIEEYEAFFAKVSLRKSSVIAMIASIHERRNEDEQAARLYADAVELYPKSLWLYIRFAEVCLKLRRYGDAIAVAEKVTLKRPNSTEAWLCIARAAFRSKQYEKAKQAYLALQNLDKQIGHFGIGLIAAINADLTTAAKELQKVREAEATLSKKDSVNSYSLRQAIAAKENLGRYQRAAAQSPQDLSPKRQLADAYLKLFLRDEAIEISLAVLNALPEDTSAISMLATAYNRLDTQASVWYKKLAQLDSSRYDAAKALALDAYRRAENADEIIARLRRCVQMNPTDEAAWSWLAATYRRLGKTEDEIAVCKAALEVNPANENIGEALGWAYHRTGRYAEAVSVLKDVVWQYPESTEPKMRLGLAYLALGDEAEARRIQGELKNRDSITWKTLADALGD